MPTETFRLTPSIRRRRTFCGITIGTTGLPVRYARQAAALAKAPQSQQLEWIADTFLSAVPLCCYRIPEGMEAEESPLNMPPLDANGLDLDSLAELFSFVCGNSGGGESVPPFTPSPEAPPSGEPTSSASPSASAET